MQSVTSLPNFMNKKQPISSDSSFSTAESQARYVAGTFFFLQPWLHSSCLEDHSRPNCLHKLPLDSYV